MAPTDASGSLISVSVGHVRYEVVAAACWDAVRNGGVPLCIRCCGDFFGVLGFGARCLKWSWVVKLSWILDSFRGRCISRHSGIFILFITVVNRGCQQMVQVSVHDSVVYTAFILAINIYINIEWSQVHLGVCRYVCLFQCGCLAVVVLLLLFTFFFFSLNVCLSVCCVCLSGCFCYCLFLMFLMCVFLFVFVAVVVVCGGGGGGVLFVVFFLSVFGMLCWFDKRAQWFCSFWF